VARAIILATWEAGIRRIKIGGQSRQGVREIPSQPIAKHGGAYLSSQAKWEAEIHMETG
jgi:hypothetical protein